jgi:DNA polymerase I-like protein with 3'-5' exonuclease and polymerase domains
MVACEYHSRRTIRLWLDGEPAPPQPPFTFDADVLFVAFFASAELGCFLALGWPMPAHVLDLYVETKWDICGKDGEPNKPSLVYALDRYGLDSLDVTEKEEMRQLAMRQGWTYSDAERQALLDYCESDVKALIRLLQLLLPRFDLPRALLRGQFMRAVAHIESNGIPIDCPTLALLNKHWETLQLQMVETVDAEFEVFEGTHFRVERFARFLHRQGIPWPRRQKGELDINDDVFKDMAERYPVLQPLRQLRQALDMLHLSDLPVGKDGRNRCLMSPFGTITGRCAPSTTRFILGRPAWMRSLIRPEEGRALAHIDWSSQEYGIGAVLSGDPAMIADYEAGDPYLGFAKRIGMTPPNATKQTHRAERDIIKSVILGTQYGMGEQTLAVRINKPVVYARDLLRAHRMTYRKFWEWSDAAVSQALFRGRLWTRFGWQTWTRYRKPTDRESGDPNIRSLSNFPCQGNAADMLRFAAGYMCDADIMLDATIHDAVLVEATDDAIDGVLDETRRAMDRASELVLYGFKLRTDYEVIHWPNRYRDERGAAFFDELMNRLEHLISRPRSYRPWEEVPYGW